MTVFKYIAIAYTVYWAVCLVSKAFSEMKKHDYVESNLEKEIKQTSESVESTLDVLLGYFGILMLLTLIVGSIYFKLS